MGEMAQIIADNGIAVMSFIALIYLIFWDKKQTNEKEAIREKYQQEREQYQQERDNKFISILDNINTNMIITNERLADLENKVKDKEKS